MGPTDELGEGSIALNGKLLGKSEPANYREIRGKSPFSARDAWVTPPAAVLIFPGTLNRQNPYLTADRIVAAARPHFESWGGAQRLKACFELARSMAP